MHGYDRFSLEIFGVKYCCIGNCESALRICEVKSQELRCEYGAGDEFIILI